VPSNFVEISPALVFVVGVGVGVGAGVGELLIFVI